MADSEFDFSISILLIESDEANRRLLCETLEAIGFKILQAGSLDGARKILGAQKADIVMIDALMPEGSGIEFMIQLKKGRPEIPVIVLTAVLDNATKDEILKAGADGVLSRPFRINRVEELITSILLKYDQAALSNPISKHKILVTDDDDSMLAFLIEALKILGFDVVACRTGAGAKEAFVKENFDLAISDFMLPDTNGLFLLRELKRIKPALPIVIVTGYRLAYTPAMAKADGIDGYLGKPFRINQLEQVIANLLYPEKARKPQNN